MRLCEVKWSEVKWSEVKWSVVKWSEVKWSEVQWSEVKWSEVKWSEVKSSELTLQRTQATHSLSDPQFRRIFSNLQINSFTTCLAFIVKFPTNRSIHLLIGTYVPLSFFWRKTLRYTIFHSMKGALGGCGRRPREPMFGHQFSWSLRLFDVCFMLLGVSAPRYACLLVTCDVKISLSILTINCDL